NREPPPLVVLTGDCMALGVNRRGTLTPALPHEECYRSSPDPACADAPCLWEPGELAFDRSVTGRRSASGRRGAVAEDARARAVRHRHRSWEADEQSGGTICRRCCGAGGAKGGGQGERARAKHAPDAEPGARVTGARSRTESR